MPRVRLPFYYGWLLVATAFVTMGIGVNARTAFSLFFPPILNEFGWDRGVTAGAFSFGFLVSAAFSPLLGRLVDRRGPRLMVEGSVCLAYTGHALFLPQWFVRRRGLAVSIAFSGVGVGSIVLLPWVQVIIASGGWRHACVVFAIVVLVVLAPLNLVLRRRPEDLGLLPDGDTAPRDARAGAHPENVVDPVWVAVDWTLPRALRTTRFWWVVVAYFCGLFAWYAVQVHQTKYLTEIGFSPTLAAWALGLVSLAGIPGQVILGHVSDRVGREWVWTLGSLGFALCFALLLAMQQAPTPLLLYSMVVAQGALGYGLTSVFGAIPAEIFQGRQQATIFGTINLAAIGGGAVGPWLTGTLHDVTGSYVLAFWIAIGCSAVSAGSIWLAAPRKVRAVAGRIPRRAT